MKKSLNIMIAVVLAFGMIACGEKKLTKEDLEAAEATLFDENQSINKDVAPKVAEKYCRYVEQNPDDSTAAISWGHTSIMICLMIPPRHMPCFKGLSMNILRVMSLTMQGSPLSI